MPEDEDENTLTGNEAEKYEKGREGKKDILGFDTKSEAEARERGQEARIEAEKQKEEREEENEKKNAEDD